MFQPKSSLSLGVHPGTEGISRERHDGPTQVYRLSTSIVERDGLFHVRVAATLGSRLHGTIAQERLCDSRQAAEITEGLLIHQVRAAVKAIGAALNYSDDRHEPEISEGEVG